jgi:hypothetical protein
MARYPVMIPDTNGNPIPALRIGTIVNDSVSGTSRESTIPTGARIVEIAANTDCWVLIGVAGATVSNTTGFFFPKGAAIYAVGQLQTSVQYIQDSATGRISITELV